MNEKSKLKDLKAICKAKGYNTARLAADVNAKGVKCVPTTLYKMYQRKDEHVEFGTIRAVCQVLGITLDQYDKLEPCPRKSEFDKEIEL
jgi:DNA-binding Xre family transcriptional regulator